MPKTIAITPSWYWPAQVPRVVGVPPFGVHELLVERRARREPDSVAIIANGERITNRELATRIADASSVFGAGSPLDVSSLAAQSPTIDGAVALLGLLAAGAPVRLADQRADATEPERRAGLAEAVVGFTAGDAVAWHSQRSLLCGAISMCAFLQAQPGRPWLSTLPLTSWDGVCALLTGLVTGAPVVLSAPGEAALAAIARESAGFAWTDLESAFNASREAKREVKTVRGVLTGMLLATAGTFDPDQRRRVGRLFECPALTIFGLPETGPIFASHPSWYIDEAMGIPVTNAHVVPVDPRSGAALSTLWELVESAVVAVWSPMCMLGYEAGAHQERFHDGRFVTGVVASSDANGMIYVLPD